MSQRLHVSPAPTSRPWPPRGASKGPPCGGTSNCCGVPSVAASPAANASGCGASAGGVSVGTGAACGASAASGAGASAAGGGGGRAEPEDCEPRRDLHRVVRTGRGAERQCFPLDDRHRRNRPARTNTRDKTAAEAARTPNTCPRMLQPTRPRCLAQLPRDLRPGVRPPPPALTRRPSSAGCGAPQTPHPLPSRANGSPTRSTAAPPAACPEAAPTSTSAMRALPPGPRRPRRSLRPPIRPSAAPRPPTSPQQLAHHSASKSTPEACLCTSRSQSVVSIVNRLAN